MKKFSVVSVLVILTLGIAFLFSLSGFVAARQTTLMEFNSMAGVPRPYTGSTNAIRGVPGGGLPWVIGYGQGELSARGKLEVTVSGLVLDPNDAVVISRGLGGTNPSPNFKAVVSCLSKDANGAPVTVNVSSGLFPADAMGNAHIEDQLTLPSPCIAPIIFVTNPAGAWFAVTGN